MPSTTRAQANFLASHPHNSNMGGTQNNWNKQGEEHRMLLWLFKKGNINSANWANKKAMEELRANPNYPFHPFSSRVFMAKIREIAVEKQQNNELGERPLLLHRRFFLPLSTHLSSAHILPPSPQPEAARSPPRRPDPSL